MVIFVVQIMVISGITETKIIAKESSDPFQISNCIEHIYYNV